MIGECVKRGHGECGCDEAMREEDSEGMECVVGEWRVG